MYTAITTCPVTATVFSGRASTVRTLPGTSRVTQTATFTICSNCAGPTTAASSMFHSQHYSPVPTQSQHTYYNTTIMNMNSMRPTRGGYSASGSMSTPSGNSVYPTYNPTASGASHPILSMPSGSSYSFKNLPSETAFS